MDQKYYQISKFRKGSTTYTCESCGKLTRDTGNGEAEPTRNGGVRGCCIYCYTMGGWDNSVADGETTVAEYNDIEARMAKKYHQPEDKRSIIKTK